MNESFGDILDQFHEDNPNAWKEMKQAKKRGYQGKPKREIDFIDFLIEYFDLEIITDIIFHSIYRGRKIYAKKMSEIDRTDGLIPSEVSLATAGVIEDQRFLSQFEIDYQASKSFSDPFTMQPQVQSRKELERVFARDDVFKRKNRLVKGELAEDKIARKNIKKVLEMVKGEIKKHTIAKGKVMSGLPDGLSLIKSSIDIDRINHSKNQIRQTGVAMSEKTIYGEIREKISQTHWKPGVGLIVLRTQRYTDYMIDMAGNREIACILVKHKKQAIEECIKKLQEISSSHDEDIGKIIEYLKNLLIILP